MSARDVSHTRTLSTERAVEPFPAAESTPGTSLTHRSAEHIESNRNGRIAAQDSGANVESCAEGNMADAELIEIDLREKEDSSADVEKALPVILNDYAQTPNDASKTVVAAVAYVLIWVITFTAWSVFSWYFVHACFWPVPAVGLGASNNIFAVSIGVILAFTIIMLVTIGYSTHRLIPSIFPRLREVQISKAARRRCTGRSPVIAALCVSALVATGLYLAFIAGTLAQPYSAACDADMPVTAFISVSMDGTSGVVALYDTVGGSTWTASGHIGQALGELQFTTDATMVNNSTLIQAITGSSQTTSDRESVILAMNVLDADISTSFDSHMLGWAGAWPAFTISSALDSGTALIRGAAIAPSSCRTVKVCSQVVEDRDMVELFERVFFAQSRYVLNGCS